MALEEFAGYPLGCNVPDEFPTMFTKAADAIPMMTWEEIRSFLAGKSSAWNRRAEFGDDWIASQDRYGSCNGWSTAKALERLRWLRGIRPRTKLSGADAYSQMNGGRDNGSTLADGMRVVQQNGVSTEDLVRVDQIYTHQISAEAKAARARFKGFECYAVDDEQELATGLCLGFIAVVAVHATSGFDSLDGDGCPRSGNGPGNHSTGVDDVSMKSDGTLLYDMFNSWRVAWGDRGRCRLRWSQHLRQTAQNHRFFLMRSTLDDPQGDNPPVATTG